MTVRGGDLSTHADLSLYRFEGYDVIHVRAGYKGTRRIVPPAGEDRAFEVARWRHRIEISISPTGRAVQVHIDGKRVWRSSC